MLSRGAAVSVWRRPAAHHGSQEAVSAAAARLLRAGS